MAFIRNCTVLAVMALLMSFTNAQTVSYPALASQLLKSTATDAANLLNQAKPGSNFITEEYSTLPANGIILIYDSTITDNLACRVQSDGNSYIKFSAAEDNGLCFGLYQYLQNLGFRFYLPGTIWQTIPTLSNIYIKTDSIYNSEFKYNGWFISGGHNIWVMDNNRDYNWDVYYGQNGHNWALYQRRNGMTGKYRFMGHRGDITTGAYLTTLQNNPCYVANFNNSRAASASSVPDINNEAAINLWATAIEEKFTSLSNAIHSNVPLYINRYRKMNYNYHNIGIEVPDGARWGNSTDLNGCPGNGYPSESDQHIILSNKTAEKLNSDFPGKHYQVYAYSRHADIPSPGIAINSKIDVQLIPEVYQNFTSPNGLRNRWYNLTKNISEYNYLNLSGWSGETPAFDLTNFKETVQLAIDKKSQGLVWETSPAKFASLPYLYAANKNLLAGINIDKSLQEFCDAMFGHASQTVYELLHFWVDSKNITGVASNKYKLPYLLNLISTANVQTQADAGIVKERMLELKAYMHYMTMYLDWTTDQRSNEAKKEKAAALCIYLARINKMMLVNSYYLITTITAKYASTSDFYLQYNCINGTAYQNGNLPLITADEIENNFISDKAEYNNLINEYKFETSSFIKDKLATDNLNALQKINVQLKYTNGIDNYNSAAFYINAPGAGKFSVAYNPVYNLPGKGYINFLVEKVGGKLQVLNDVTIGYTDKAGELLVQIPTAGIYKFTITSKYQSTVNLQIDAGKNIFYKSGAFFGNTTEIYTDVNNMPGYFYVPAGIDKVFFSISNSNPGGNGFASPEKINKEFEIKDNDGNSITARFVTSKDSALFYIPIPAGSRGKFCRITKKSNYGLLFSNISNYLWYAQPKPAPCKNSAFTISVLKIKENCITRLTANNSSDNYEWQVNDNGNNLTYNGQRIIDLPANSSPNTSITLTTGNNCSTTKKLREDKNYLQAIQACAAGAALPEATGKPIIYPNPSTGYFTCMMNGVQLKADEINILNVQGTRVADFNQANGFNIGYLPTGIYWYKLKVKEKEYSGRLIKL